MDDVGTSRHPRELQDVSRNIQECIQGRPRGERQTQASDTRLVVRPPQAPPTQEQVTAAQAEMKRPYGVGEYDVDRTADTARHDARRPSGEVAADTGSEPQQPGDQVWGHEFGPQGPPAKWVAANSSSDQRQVAANISSSSGDVVIGGSPRVEVAANSSISGGAVEDEPEDEPEEPGHVGTEHFEADVDYGGDVHAEDIAEDAAEKLRDAQAALKVDMEDLQLEVLKLNKNKMLLKSQSDGLVHTIDGLEHDLDKVESHLTRLKRERNNRTGEVRPTIKHACELVRSHKWEEPRMSMHRQGTRITLPVIDYCITSRTCNLTIALASQWSGEQAPVRTAHSATPSWGEPTVVGPRKNSTGGANGKPI